MPLSLSPPTPPQTTIHALLASSTPLEVGAVASAAIPSIDCGVPLTSEDQLPPLLSPPPLPPPTTSWAPTLLLCHPVVRHLLASHPPPPLSSSCSPPAHLTWPLLPPLFSLCCLLPADRTPCGNITTTLLLCPPPPPSCSLQAVHCRLWHAASANIVATIVATTSSSPTNAGVHPWEESHGVCHGLGASSGARNVVGIAPPRWHQCRAVAAGNPHKGGGEGGQGKPSS